MLKPAQRRHHKAVALTKRKRPLKYPDLDWGAPLRVFAKHTDLRALRPGKNWRGNTMTRFLRLITGNMTAIGIRLSLAASVGVTLD